MAELTDSQKRKKQKDLNEFLRDLSVISCSDEQIIGKSRILLQIYNEEFRHSYAQILGTIYDIKKDSGSLDFLAENIEFYKEKIT